MDEHARVGCAVWWPASSDWMWSVDHIVVCMDGTRLLAISRGDTEADIATRVVPESECRSNAFTAADTADA